MKLLILLLCVLLSGQPANCMSSPVATEPMDFGEVSPMLWRGGVPDQSVLNYLAQHHFNTILDLRTLYSGREAQACAKLGMRYIWLPMTIFMFPSKETVGKFLYIVNNPAYGKVYMHCLAGGDRSGMLIAIYRMVDQNWTFEQAHAEMEHFHFRPWLNTFLETVKESKKLYGPLAHSRNAQTLGNNQ
jgi:protein tyrosine/serine phosphatase